MRLGARHIAVLSCLFAAFAGGVALGQTAEPQRHTLEQLKRFIAEYPARENAGPVDHERLTVRRLDVVDDKGRLRLTLAGRAPEPILDGIRYKRTFDASGITIFDENGSEKGGLGTASGGVAAFAFDHANADALGWRVMPDGSILFTMNQRSPLIREPAPGNRLLLNPSKSRLKMTIASDGTPAIELADGAERPRLRLTVNAAGQGAIEFLDPNGRVIHSLTPEAERGGG